MRRLACVLALLTAASLSGCSLFVMGGRMLFGDPLVPSDFRKQTGVNLCKDEKKLLVLCTTAEFIKSEVPALDLDLTEAVARRLKLNGVDIVDSNRVSKWLDDHAGQGIDMQKLGEKFDADYLANIRIDEFALKEPNSPALFQGKASGTISVFQVQTHEGKRHLSTVFTQGFETRHPSLNPVSTDRLTESAFQRQFVGHLTELLARHFYDYGPGEDI